MTKIFAIMVFVFLVAILAILFFGKRYAFFLLKIGMATKDKIFIIIFLSLTFFSLFQLSFGDKYGYYFFVNPNPSYELPSNTKSDLYVSIIDESGGKWGEKMMKTYPPLATFPYQVLAKMLPYELVKNDRTRNWEKTIILRDTMPGSVIGIVNNLLFILPFVLICVFFIQGDKIRKILYTSLLSISGVMIWVLERGNLISYSFLFLLLFVILYENGKTRSLKLVSYFFLAISANLKIYPACFGMLLLIKKDYRGVAYSIVISIIIYILSFFLCGYAPSEFGRNFLNVFSYSDSYTAFLNNYNFSARNFLALLNYLLVKIAGKFQLLDLHNFIFIAFTFLEFFIGLFISWYSSLFWKRLAGLSLLCILVPVMSWQYALIFLFIPLLYFINDYDDSKSSRFYAVLFAIIISFLIIPISASLQKQPLTANFVVQDFAVQFLMLTLFLESLHNYWEQRSLANKKII
ncbi:MAG: DUF2029 domain-containing protein [Spirochaetia bacterium]|nr:DUF2029 domain-containing protein [Spirochaetia bacterium]